jgi:hypothetical protein
MDGIWKADRSASIARRLGDPPDKLGSGNGRGRCPDIWELDNGDIAVVGSDMTEVYATRLPDGLGVGEGERLVIVPRVTFVAAKAAFPDE